MHVGDQRLWRVLEKVREQREVRAVIVKGRGVFQVPLMLRQYRFAIPQEAESSLELTTEGEKLRGLLELPTESDPRWREASCATQEARNAIHDPHYGIVDAICDFAIVG